MKRPSDLTIDELKIVGPAAVRHAAVLDFAYEQAQIQKAAKNKPLSDVKRQNLSDKLKA